MINKSNYRTTNLTIIKTDWEDKDRDRKGQTLTKTLTFNFKNLRILTWFITLTIHHITLLIWIHTLLHTLAIHHITIPTKCLVKQILYPKIRHEVENWINKLENYMDKIIFNKIKNKITSE